MDHRQNTAVVKDSAAVKSTRIHGDNAAGHRQNTAVVKDSAAIKSTGIPPNSAAHIHIAVSVDSSASTVGCRIP